MSFKTIKVVFRVICTYEDDSREPLESFDKYGDAQTFIETSPYCGDMTIEKVWEKNSELYRHE